MTTATTIVVCGQHSYFADDVRTTCAICSRPIVRRPWHDAQRCQFQCVPCSADEIRKHGVTADPRSVAEADLYFTKGTRA